MKKDLPEFEALKEFKEEDFQNQYRYLFTSDIGRIVLGDILKICHFGCTLDSNNPQQVGEYNVGVMILLRCGILGEGTLQGVVNALCNIPISTKEE